MISKETVKNLADLVRIEIDEKEAEKLAGEMDAILGYVDQVKEVVGLDSSFNIKGVGGIIEFGAVKNVFREDADTNESGAYSKELIAEFPDREGDYLKVKKIL